MEKNILDNGDAVVIRFRNGPVLENTWDVMSERYGRELDAGTLSEIVRKVEGSVGYDYMTDREREEEFWSVLGQGEQGGLHERP